MRHAHRWVAAMVLMASVSAAESWDRDAAARYLDQRAELWTSRARERQKLPTACISCHTGMPYLLSRMALAPPSMPEPTRVLFGDVRQRVANWDSVRVWYDESRGAEKPDQSRGTESVLNALVLTVRDRRAGTSLTPETKAALGHMWEQQKEDGHWSWIHFGLGPWETDGSDYWGAALAAVAGMTAESDVAAPVEGKARLRSFLRAGLDRDLSLHNRLSLLWAASTWPELLSEPERARLVQDVVKTERPDGGFRLKDLGPWPSKDGSAPSEESDGYATAFTVFVLERTDEPAAAYAIEQGLAWLSRKQKPDGRWESLSPNKDRSQEEDFRRLLASDAATAFAVLALTSAPSGPNTLSRP
jgi:hypothetical protein